MSMTYATIAGKITKPGSNIGIRAKVTATPLTTNKAIKFPTEDRMTWGPETAETDSSGDLGSRLKIPTNHGLTELYWQFTAEPLDKVPGLSKWTMGTFEITESTRLEDLVDVDVLTVNPDLVVNIADLVADAEAAEAAAGTSATAAQGWADAASSSAADADTSADLAAGSATSASGAASTATTKAGEASASATAAAGSATAAATSETNAAASESAAATSETNAAASETAAAGYAASAAGSVSLVAWAPATAYAAGDVRQAPDGSTIRRLANGTSGASFDTTEEAAWEAVLGNATTIDGKALSASTANSIEPGETDPQAAVDARVATLTPGYATEAVEANAIIRPTSLAGTPYAPRRVKVGRLLSLFADGAYNAWPAMTRTDSGRLIATFSSGTGHTARGGVIKKMMSDNKGATWTAASTMFSPADSVHQAMKTFMLENVGGGRLYGLGWYDDTTSGTTPADARIFKSDSTDDGDTWAATALITQPFAYLNAIECGVVVAANGDWLTAAYGNDVVSNANYCVSIGRSTDQGATWSWTKIADGFADTKAYTEPTLAVFSDGTVHCLIRCTTDGNMYRTTSADHGATWSALAVAFVGTGRPAQVVSSVDDTLIVIYRDPGLTHGAVRVSADKGVTWSDPTFFVSGAGYQYAGHFEYVPGVYGVVTGRERTSNTVGDIVFQYFSLTGQQTPFGDADFERRTPLAPMLGRNRVIAYDTMERADESPLGTTDSGHVWKAYSGSFNLASGRIKPGAATSGMLVAIDVNRSDYHEIQTTVLSSSTAFTGALVFQMADASNFYKLQFAGNGGAVTPTLYKVVAGATTSLGAGAAMNLGIGIEYPVRVTIRNGRIKCWVDDEKVIDLTDTTFTGNKRIGIQNTGATLITEWGPFVVKL